MMLNSFLYHFAAKRRLRESDIEDYLVKRVRAMGGEVRKVRWIGRRGAPDRLVMMPTATIWVELKAPGKTPEPHQLREHKRMRALGQRVEIVDSLQSVEALLS
jgi:streptogramin lyase